MRWRWSRRGCVNAPRFFHRAKSNRRAPDHVTFKQRGASRLSFTRKVQCARPFARFQHLAQKSWCLRPKSFVCRVRQILPRTFVGRMRNESLPELLFSCPQLPPNSFRHPPSISFALDFSVQTYIFRDLNRKHKITSLSQSRTFWPFFGCSRSGKALPRASQRGKRRFGTLLPRTFWNAPLMPKPEQKVTFLSGCFRASGDR